MSYEELEKHWNEFEDVPIDEDECIDDNKQLTPLIFSSNTDSQWGTCSHDDFNKP